MALDTGVRLDNERGVYVYYVIHDGAEIPFLERKTGNVDKRRKAAAEAAKQQQSEQSSGDE